jgi:MtN3 and saliva related transmembrane protein
MIDTIIGTIAGIFTSIASLPQLIKSWKTKQTKDISLLTFSILDAGVFLWAIYGIMIDDYPVMIANIITFVIVSGIVILKLKYK